MRASTAYFVGAGTIVAAIAIGLGGGIVAGNIMNPGEARQLLRIALLIHILDPPAAVEGFERRRRKRFVIRRAAGVIGPSAEIRPRL